MGFVSVTLPVAALVWPTKVAGTAMLDERLINGTVPVPLSVTVCVPLRASDGTLTVPTKFPSAVAVKVTPNVHEALGANGGLAGSEHVSDTIWKFGEGPDTPVVAAVIVPMLTATAD